MRHILTALTLCATLALPALSLAKTNAKGVSITLSLVDGERSKDSNSRSYSVTLDGDKVTYRGPHQPCVRGRCPHSKVGFTLDPKTYAKAIEAITKGALLTPLTEHKDTGQSGHYVRLTLTLKLGGKTAVTTIRGMTSARSGPASALLSEAAKKRVAAVKGLLYPFRSAAKPHLPTK